ncbi:hypothetical protein TcasGA2_TC014108 [Tribolium castaneum]|uniref:Uncharacterized protein n=1 Tax=Tribolium castaneum TaxID=7070 RepID=D6WK98_TRICA|nr:hypothetical protein TcasGA2_TC014108 [Tribolium castaneum]
MFCVSLFIFVVLLANFSALALPEPAESDSGSPVAKKDNSDAIFTFIKSLLNTGHAGAQIAINRVKAEAEKRKQLLDEIKQTILPKSSKQ